MNQLFEKIQYRAAFEKNKKYLDEILKNQKDNSRKDAYDKMTAAVDAYGISKDTYVEEKYYLLQDSALKKLLTEPSVNGMVWYAAKVRHGAPMGEVYAKALKARKKYGIPLASFVKEGLFAEKDPERFQEVKQKRDNKKNRRIEDLAEVSGWTVEEAKAYLKDINKKYGVGSYFARDKELFKLSEEEIAEEVKKKNDEMAWRTEKIKKANNWDDFDLERHRAMCNCRYHIYDIRTYDNLECWKYPMEVLDTFACQQDCFDVTRTYNTVSTEVLDNKTIFDKTYKDFLHRKFWINRDTSLDEFKEFIDGLTDIFCKPINLLGGHGSYRYHLDGSAEEMYEHFLNEPKMLLEEIPKQHHLMSEIYGNSINTVRIVTILKDGVFTPFCSWVKFGGKGSVVDGRVGGGCFAGVDANTGIVDTLAIDIDNNRFANHPDTGKPILGFQIPYWKEAIELTEKALRFYDGINFVGWDVCITENGPVIIEGNSKPGFVDIQLLYNYGDVEQPGQRWRYERFLKDPDKWRR